MSKYKKISIIEQLRQRYPGNWEYQPKTHTWANIEYSYEVGAFCTLCGPTEDDFATIYRRTDTGEPVSVSKDYFICLER